MPFITLTVAHFWQECEDVRQARASETYTQGRQREGLIVQDVITINVQPGWKDGTRITFAGKGDEQPGQPAQVCTLSL